MRNINVDLNHKKGKLNDYFKRCIGAGRAAEVMRHVAYNQLCTIQKECPFEYIRFHGLFHEEMAIVSRNTDGTLCFNFQYVDLLFDSLLDINIRPVVELGLMPQTMAEKDMYVFWWKMNISPAKKIEEWSMLVEAFVRHCTERYGEAELKKWYFEIWNEPNHPNFFSEYDNIDAYFALYDSAAYAIKSVCRDYRVGGPATAGLKWIDELILHCRENNVPLDFISSHNYCVEGAFDADGKKQLKLLPVDSLAESICRAGKECHNSALPFMITEWSASYSSRDPVHDSYFSAPFILHTLKHCDGYADMMSYWVYTDIFEEVAPPASLFHGGFGLFTVRSIPKPAYNAFRFLGMLGNTELFCDDEECYACISDQEAQILFWNIVQPELTEKTNADYFSSDIPAKLLEDATVTVCGLESEKEYSIIIETVGYRMGDCYTDYLDMGSPSEPTREQTKALCNSAQPKQLCINRITDRSGKIVLNLPQSQNQVDIIKILLAK